MNINIVWATDIPSLLPTDTFNVYYKVLDTTNLNNWILANPTPLISTTTSYTIIGLDPNTEYAAYVSKSCVGDLTQLVQEVRFKTAGCPIFGYWQGPVVSGYPTLFYSVSFPDGIHINSCNVSLYDITTVDSNGWGPPPSCATNPCGDVTFPIGRSVKYDALCPTCPGGGSEFFCGLETVNFNFPSNISSAVSYYGIVPIPTTFCPLGVYSAGQPILLDFNHDYRLLTNQVFVQLLNPPPSNYPLTTNVGNTFITDYDTCFINQIGQPSVSIVSLSNDLNRLSGCLEYNSGLVKQTIVDGTNQTDIGNYLFQYQTLDSLANTFPLLSVTGPASGGSPSPTIPVAGHNINYKVYALVEMTPVLTDPEMSNGMDVTVISNPGAVILGNFTGINMNGLTVGHLYNAIASNLTAAGYQTHYIVESGTPYIRVSIDDQTVTDIEIQINGPSIIGPGLFTGLMHNFLSTTIDATPFNVNDDVYSTTLTGNTLGQYKVITSNNWQPVPGGGNINVNPNDILEFTMFSQDIQLYQVVNQTTATTYDIPTYGNLSSLPTFNTLNPNDTLSPGNGGNIMPVFSIKCDSINISNGDVLELYFTNPFNNQCNFVSSVTINF